MSHFELKLGQILGEKKLSPLFLEQIQILENRKQMMKILISIREIYKLRRALEKINEILDICPNCR